MKITLTHSERLAALRATIDRLDARLLRLMARRQQLVQQIARQKADKNAIPAYERLLPMLKHRGEQARALGLDTDFTTRIFQQLAHQAMAVQRRQLDAAAAAKPNPNATASEQGLPLVYSCSGCSSSAQLANDLALALDRERQAEMSCIAGVGGDVAALLKPAKSGRVILVIDGCSRACAKHCLQRHGVAPTQHVILSQHGVKKHLHRHYSAEELIHAKQVVIDLLPCHSATGSSP